MPGRITVANMNEARQKAEHAGKLQLFAHKKLVEAKQALSKPGGDKLVKEAAVSEWERKYALAKNNKTQASSTCDLTIRAYALQPPKVPGR